MVSVLKKIAGWFLSWRSGANCEDFADDSALHLQAWSISARLAALPPDFADQVPPVVAQLIEEAKQLHPGMLSGADERERNGDSPQVWRGGFGAV